MRVAGVDACEPSVAGNADIPSIIALMSRTYCGFGEMAGRSTENSCIKGDRTTEARLGAEVAEQGIQIEWAASIK